MQLGAFSVSLSVADLAASRAFYEHLGFEVTGGDPDAGWQILRNGHAMLGLFQGLFEGNVLTFNPGIDQDMSRADDPDDVRDIHDALADAGVEMTYDAPGMEPTEEPLAGDPGDAGHFMLVDPDGNGILVDQFPAEVLDAMATG